jgi:hypothetical protein
MPRTSKTGTLGGKSEKYEKSWTVISFRRFCLLATNSKRVPEQENEKYYNILLYFLVPLVLPNSKRIREQENGKMLYCFVTFCDFVGCCEFKANGIQFLNRKTAKYYNILLYFLVPLVLPNSKRIREQENGEML